MKKSETLLLGLRHPLEGGVHAARRSATKRRNSLVCVRVHFKAVILPPCAAKHFGNPYRDGSLAAGKQ